MFLLNLRGNIRSTLSHEIDLAGDQLSPEHRSPVDPLPELAADLRRDSRASGASVIAAAALGPRLGHEDLLRRPLLPDHRKLPRQSAL